MAYKESPDCENLPFANNVQQHFFTRYVELDPFLDAAQARSLVQLCEDFESYGMYSEEGLNDGIGEGLPQRFDAAFNFVPHWRSVGAPRH